MSDDKTGGPAFPVQESIVSGSTSDVPASSGMTLRDYFAAKAMQAFITKYDDSRDDMAGPVVSKMAYAIADAMLAARKEAK